MLSVPDGGWNLYFDAYTRKHVEGMHSADLKTWGAITDQIMFPKDIRHGTMFVVSKKVFTKLAASSSPVETKPAVPESPLLPQRPSFFGTRNDD